MKDCRWGVDCHRLNCNFVHPNGRHIDRAGPSPSARPASSRGRGRGSGGRGRGRHWGRGGGSRGGGGMSYVPPHLRSSGGGGRSGQLRAAENTSDGAAKPPLEARSTDTAAAAGMAGSEQYVPGDVQDAVAAAKTIEARAHSASSAPLPTYRENAPWPPYTATNSAAGGAAVQGTSSLSRFDLQNDQVEQHYDNARQRQRPAIQKKQGQRPPVLEAYQHTAHFNQRQEERNISEEELELVLRNPDFVVKQHERDKYVKTLDGNRTITLITEGSLCNLYRDKLITTYKKNADLNPIVIVFLSVPDDGRRKLLTIAEYPCGKRWPCLDILGSMAQFKFKGLSSEMHGSQPDIDEKCLYHAAQLWTLKSSSILLDIALFTDAMAVDECIDAAASDKKWSQNRHGDKLISLIADVDPDLKLVPQPFSQELMREYAVRTSKHNGKLWDDMVEKFRDSTVWVLEDGDDGDERSLLESIYDYVRAINSDACGSAQALSTRWQVDKRSTYSSGNPYLHGDTAAAGVLDVDELSERMRTNPIDSMRGNDELFLQATLNYEADSCASGCGAKIRARVPNNDVGFNREGLQSIHCRYSLQQDQFRREREPEVQPGVEPEPEPAGAEHQIPAQVQDAVAAAKEAEQ